MAGLLYTWAAQGFRGKYLIYPKNGLRIDVTLDLSDYRPDLESGLYGKIDGSFWSEVV